MHNPSSVDRDNFQQLLSNAYKLQQREIDHQSLADIGEVQRAIASETFNVDGIFQHIVESASRVSHASGAAIGVLNQAQLIYWAGSGSLADSVGTQVTVSLTDSAHANYGREILRVDNAASAPRIEADTCRQRGANALLILPIHHDRALAGVLEILFAEAHTFENREILTYWSLVEQVESAIRRAVHLEQELEKETSPASGSIPISLDQSQPEEDSKPAPVRMMRSTSEPSLYQRVAAVMVAIREITAFNRTTSAFMRSASLIEEAGEVFKQSALNRSASAFRQTASVFQQTGPLFKQSASVFKQSAAGFRQAASVMKQSAPVFKQAVSVFNRSASALTQAVFKQANSVFKKEVPFFATAWRRATNRRWQPRLNWRPHLHWQLRRLHFAVTAAVVLAFAVLLAYRVQHPPRPAQATTLPVVPSIAPRVSLPKPSPAAASVAATRTLNFARPAKATPVTKGLRNQEVHYIGDDVTVRIFHEQHASKPRRAAQSRVAHIGNDVTVRYFAPPQPTAKFSTP